MARWRLSTSHYLLVQGNQWEYKETDRTSGRELRKRIDVPMFLDVSDQALWNDNIIRNPRGEILEGDVVVAYASGAHNDKDYIFTGEPSPDMIPMDDEAKEISDKFVAKWNMAPNENVTMGQQVIEAIEKVELVRQSQPQLVKIEGIAEVVKTMADMMTMNQQLMQQMIQGQAARRV